MLSPHITITLWNTLSMRAIHIKALKQYSEKAQAFFFFMANSQSKFGELDFLQKTIKPVSQDLHQSLMTQSGEREL